MKEKFSKDELKIIYNAARETDFDRFYTLFAEGIPPLGIQNAKSQQPTQEEIMLTLYKAAINANDLLFIEVFKKYNVDVDIYCTIDQTPNNKTFLSLILELDTDQSPTYTQGLINIARFLLTSGADITKQPYDTITGDPEHSPLQIIKAVESKREVDKDYNEGGLKALWSFFKYARVYDYQFGRNIIPCIKEYRAEIIENRECDMGLRTTW